MLSRIRDMILRDYTMFEIWGENAWKSISAKRTSKSHKISLSDARQPDRVVSMVLNLVEHISLEIFINVYLTINHSNTN